MAMRHNNASQQNYKPEIVLEVLQIFGEESVEYGLALTGAPNLGSWLKNYVWTFSAGELIAAHDTPEGEESRFLNQAKRSRRVEELIIKIESSQGIRPMETPSWLKGL